MKKLLLMFALAGTLAFSQTQVAPIVNPHIQLFNAGVPCSGCFLDTFSAGTTTPLVTYSESTGTTPNANPVVADASGFVTVYMTTSSYKLRLRTAAGVTLWTQDNVSWNNLASTLSSLTVTGNSIIKPAVAATGGANQSSPTLCIDGFYFNISSLTDQWCLSDVLGTGNAPTTTFTVTHAGSGGTATINLPNVAVSGILGLTNSGDETLSATSTLKWGSVGIVTPDSGISRVGAASIALGNGTQGNNTANVQAGNYYLNSGAAGVWGFITSMFDQVSTGCARWSSGANATTGIDSGICRGGAAATVAIGNGTAGNASGTVKAAKLNNGADLAIPATGSNVVSDTATQTLSGKGFSDKVTLYNNIATASNGLASTVASPALTGQTANIAATTAYAVPASGAGKYLVTVYIIVTTVGTTSTLPSSSITWTDRDNSTLQTATLTGTNTGDALTTVASGMVNISVKASTNIQISTSGYASTGTPMQYAIRVEVIAL